MLEAAAIESDMQVSSNVELESALKNASKNQTGGVGHPDHIAVVKDFVLVMENKLDRSKLCLLADGEIDQSVEATRNYAVNGAVFYAQKILAHSTYKKIFAFGNVGDRRHHIIKPVFVGLDGIKELPNVETFKNFTVENIDAYYRRTVCGQESARELELKTIVNRAKELHEHLRNYGQLGEDEKPLVVSAILLALAEKPYGFRFDQLNADSIESDGLKIFARLENRLNRAKVRPEFKREQVLNQFTLIKDRPLLNSINKSLGKTPLRFFTEYIEKHIYDAVVDGSPEDYLGRFYGEFVSYSGGDGQSLGVVLTPRHITELFCDLVDLRADDVVFDPCCGTGGFLIAAMHRMLNSTVSQTERDRIKQKQIHGIEVREDMFSIATTNMILRGDGQSNLICGDFLSKDAGELQLLGLTVGLMNPPYSQAKTKATMHLSELRFILHLLDSISSGGRAAVIVPVSAMIGKTKDDKFIKREILRRHTLEGVINLNKNTFYRIGTVPCAAVFTTGKPHPKDKPVKFINFEDDGFEVKKHLGLIETERAKDRRQYLIDCWRDRIEDVPSKFMVETTIEDGDEWLHSFYYYNDELPTEDEFVKTIADYLTFEFNMIAHGRGYLFDGGEKKNEPLNENEPVTWKTFNLPEIFSIHSASSSVNKDQLFEGGDIPYVTRTDRNNGIQDFVYEQKNHRRDTGRCITVGSDTQTAFYQPTAFYSGQSIKILNGEGLNLFTAKFLLTMLRKTLSIYSWGSNGATLTRLKRSRILLPVTESGDPDFEFMERFVREREARLVRRYLERLRAETLECIDEPPTLSDQTWKAFYIEDVAEIHSGRDIYEDERRGGSTPYIGASSANNGVCHFVDNVNETLEARCISVNRNGSVGFAFYHPYAALYSNDCRKLRPKIDDEFASIFIARQITAQREKYSYGYKMGTARLRRQKILLPSTESGEPDFEYMSTYVRALYARLVRRYVHFKRSGNPQAQR